MKSCSTSPTSTGSDGDCCHLFLQHPGSVADPREVPSTQLYAGSFALKCLCKVLVPTGTSQETGVHKTTAQRRFCAKNQKPVGAGPSKACHETHGHPGASRADFPHHLRMFWTTSHSRARKTLLSLGMELSSQRRPEMTLRKCHRSAGVRHVQLAWPLGPRSGLSAPTPDTLKHPKSPAALPCRAEAPLHPRAEQEAPLTPRSQSRVVAWRGLVTCPQVPQTRLVGPPLTCPQQTEPLGHRGTRSSPAHRQARLAYEAAADNDTSHG